MQGNSSAPTAKTWRADIFPVQTEQTRNIYLEYEFPGTLTICMEFSGGIFGTNGTVYFFR